MEHWLAPIFAGWAGYGDALGEGVYAADQLGRVLKRNGLALVGYGILQILRDVILGKSQNQDFVVGQKALIDCLAKANAVNLLAVQRLIIHGAKNGVILFGARLGLIHVKPRGGGHVKALSGLDEFVVMDAHKGGFLRVLERDASGAVRLVADDQIKLAPEFPLRLSHSLD